MPTLAGSRTWTKAKGKIRNKQRHGKTDPAEQADPDYLTPDTAAASGREPETDDEPVNLFGKRNRSGE